MNKRLPWPLNTVLQNAVAEQDVARMWQNIQQQRAQSQPRPLFFALGWASAGAALGFACALFLLQGHKSFVSTELALADGSSARTIDAPSEPAVWHFADRSVVHAAVGAKLNVVENNVQRVRVAQASGKVRYRITPGGPRRWYIDTALATVEVMGTEFTVDRRADALNVLVHHGVVIVRGKTVPNGLQILQSGQAFHLQPHTQVLASSATPSQTQLAPLPVTVPPALPINSVPNPSTPSATSRAHTSIAPSSTDAVQKILASADDARAKGELPHAESLYKEVVENYPHDTRAALAAFTLGRMQLDAMHKPAHAALTFARALRLGLPASLMEDAYVRLAQAQFQANDAEGARKTGDEYRLRFPNGQRAAEFDRWAPAH